MDYPYKPEGLTMWRFEAVLQGRVVGSTIASSEGAAKTQLRHDLQRGIAQLWWSRGGVVRKAGRA